MNDLVEKIKPALVTEMMNAYSAASKTPYSYPPNVCDGFGAAAKVLLEAALKEVRRTLDAQTTLPEDHKTAIVNTVKNRLLAPKTIEERVEVKHNGGDPGGWGVYRDGLLTFGMSGLARCNAEIYRKGLIAEMKGHNGSE